MSYVYSAEPLDEYVYVARPHQQAVVYLRENIVHDFHDEQDGEAIEFWRADEVVTTTDLPESEIMDNFDALWVKGVTESKDVCQRLSEIEAALDATMAVVLGEE